MKTEEDEAFDDLARRQGMWGGGFQAKRQMAADKLQEPEREALKMALRALETERDIYCEHDEDGAPEYILDAIARIKASLAQPASDYERGFIDGMQKQAQSSVDKAVNQMALPAQEPKRPWVGLTDEDRKAALLTAYKEWECEEFLLCAREDYLLIEQALKEKNT